MKAIFSAMRSFLVAGCFLLIFALVGCGTTNLGGSEAGNPEDELRVVTGTVSSTPVVASLSLPVAHAALGKRLRRIFPAGATHAPVIAKAAGFSRGVATNRCVADEVVAIDSEGEETDADVSENCTFRLEVRVPDAYELIFLHDGEFVGAMEFDNDGSGFLEATFQISDDEDDLDFGDITFTGRSALAEFRAAEQNDLDDDGIFDFFEDDDDGDGIDDDFEDDCDLDGYYDFFDDEDDECEDLDEDDVDVVRVSPRHDSFRNIERRRVDLDRPVRARVACDIDEDALEDDDEILIVESEFGDEIVCELSVGADGRVLHCEHDEDFEEDTVYTAYLEGLLCEDGREVEERTWSWITRAQ